MPYHHRCDGQLFFHVQEIEMMKDIGTAKTCLFQFDDFIGCKRTAQKVNPRA